MSAPRSTADGSDKRQAPWAGRDRVVTPISQLLIREGGLGRFEDTSVFPWAGRIRAPLAEVSIDDGELAMAVMIRGIDGGPLRTFSGALGHENGWFHSRKTGEMLGWEGETAYQMLVCAETEHTVARVRTESVQFEFVHDGRHHRYTSDVELILADGSTTLVEMKRSEKDLDEDLRLVLAYVAEVCRRCGIRFLVVFKDDVFHNRIHRRNAHFVYSRAFLEPSGEHLGRLLEHAGSTGGATTRGALATALSPDAKVLGRALVDALIVRRRVRMDLAVRVDDASPVLIV